MPLGKVSIYKNLKNVFNETNAMWNIELKFCKYQSKKKEEKVYIFYQKLWNKVEDNNRNSWMYKSTNKKKFKI